MNIGAFILLSLSILVLLALIILRGRKGPRPQIRPLAAFQDLIAETGYAAESGGAVHIALGSGTVYGEDAMTSLAGLQVVDALADAAISYGAPPVITVGDPTLLPLAQDMLRRAYERNGLADSYNPARVRFIASSPVGYAAGAANVVAGENITANMMTGAFGAEVSLVSDASARRGLSQLAAVASPGAIAALYPATDRLAAGEDLYSAGAQMTKDRVRMVSLVAQDVLRAVLVLAILGMTGLTVYQQLMR